MAPRSTKAKRAPAPAAPRWALRHILLPTDLSLASQKALRYGCSLARAFGAGVTLLHVVPAKLPADLSHLPVVFHPRAAAREARRRLARWRKALGQRGLTVHAATRVGNPERDIGRFARSARADLIILSTHGYSGAKRFWVGSTTERVVRSAPCPVLVVRMHERDFVSLNDPHPR